MSEIFRRICRAIMDGGIDPNHIAPSDLREIGVLHSTSSTFMSKHPERFKRVARGVYQINRMNEEFRSIMDTQE
ncbi:MAG: hypothetical protein ACE5KV_02190 [Thermoplasmata archaeon]